jgi:hypothetical protein
MAKSMKKHKKPARKRLKKIVGIIALEILIILILFGSYQLFLLKMDINKKQSDQSKDVMKPITEDGQTEGNKNNDDKLSPAELAAKEEQERLAKEEQGRQDLIAKADRIALGYDYDKAIELLQSYQGAEGDYKIYKSLTSAIDRLKAEQASMVLYGGSYKSVTQFNHIFFHSLVADNSKAFDGDYDAKGYNMYMTTVYEFNKIMQKMYEDGYVLVRMDDIIKKETLEDGSTKFSEGEIYLPKGKKPFLLSVDDVSYYPYMDGDGFASRIVIGEDGKITCEMIKEDGSVITGPFDVVPLLDAFIEEHPDFSYKGAKGLLALTGYEGVLGYRTNDPESPTYNQDRETAKKVADALKAEGWEFGSHSWGHKNMQTSSIGLVKQDTDRWLEEVGSLVGPTNIYVYPFGIDIEAGVSTYKSDKYQYLKKSGFDIFVGVFKEPWMQLKKDYVRVTRRPLDGQAMLQFPDRLKDLFNVEDILDPERPPMNW